jgi:hypothetical protein
MLNPSAVFNSPRRFVLALAVCLGMASSTHAGVVTGGSLLSGGDADQLETMLGVGDQDFTNIWTGTAGVSTASSFHSAVDGAGPTFSIFEISHDDGNTYRVGGYTALDWGGTTGYQYDSTAFLFNLDSLEAQFIQTYPQYAIYRNPSYFSTFGGGHDLIGGWGTLGTYHGTAGDVYDGYSNSHSYDQTQGQIAVAGDSGYGSGNSGWGGYAAWSTISLEVYTFGTATPVPAPTNLALLGLGLFGLSLFRRRQLKI